MHLYRYKLTLAIRHPSVPLEDIRRRLVQVPGIVPGVSHNVGEERVTPKGARLGGVYEESVFGFAFSDEIYSSAAKELPESIGDVITRLEPYTALLQELRNGGGSVELFVGVFIDGNCGMTLANELIKKLADLGVEMSLDIYPPERS